jgi:hypothetical protein
VTQPNPGDEARPITVGGRDVLVRPLLGSQAVLMMRLVRNLQKQKVDDYDMGAIVTNTAKILDVVESALVDQADKDYIEELIIDRKLDLKELVAVVTVFDDAAVAEKPKVRRGRPRKQA